MSLQRKLAWAGALLAFSLAGLVWWNRSRSARPWLRRPVLPAAQQGQRPAGQTARPRPTGQRRPEQTRPAGEAAKGVAGKSGKLPRLKQGDLLARLRSVRDEVVENETFHSDELVLLIEELLGRQGLAGGLRTLAQLVLEERDGISLLLIHVVDVLDERQDDDPAITWFLDTLFEQRPALLGPVDSLDFNRLLRGAFVYPLRRVLGRQSHGSAAAFFERYAFVPRGHMRKRFIDALTGGRLPNRFELLLGMREQFVQRRAHDLWLGALAGTGDPRGLEIAAAYYRKHPELEHSNGMATYLTFRGPEALPHLRRMLPGIAEGRDRYDVLKRMAQLGDREALDELVRELRNPNLLRGGMAATELQLLFKRDFGYSVGSHDHFPRQREHAIRQWERWRDSGWDPGFKAVPFERYAR